MRTVSPTASWARDISYRQTDSLSQAFGAYLQGLGLVKGDRVAVMMPNVPQYPVAVAAVLRAGLVLVNVNPLYTRARTGAPAQGLGRQGHRDPGELRRHAGKVHRRRPRSSMWCCAPWATSSACSRARWSTTWCATCKKMVPAFDLPGAVRFNEAVARGTSATLEDARDQGDDVAVLQYTGGTTGLSKGAVLLHRNLVANVLQNEAWGAAADADHPGRRAAHDRLRAAALPHLRLHLLHDAGDAHWAAS